MMQAILRRIDPAHGRQLPSGLKVADTLRLIFRRQMGEALLKLRRNPTGTRISFNSWTQEMVDVLSPLLTPYFYDGARDAITRIRRQLGMRRQRAVTWHRRKDATIIPGMDIGFDIFNPRVLEAIRAAVFQFCQSTNDTSALNVDAARAKLREELAAGLEAGEALKKLTERVQNIFADPARALTIAATETSRAMHAGQLLAAEESGVVIGKRWLASSDACPLCLALNGQEVALDEDFAVVGRGPYSHIPHPPRHPRCMCTWTEILGRPGESIPSS